MGKYCVAFRVDARYYVEVEANSVIDAKSKAALEFMDSDCGDYENVDAEIIYVQDEDDNYVWEA